jgi:hypothetical protein
MCATCVAQGVTYVGGALAALQVMAARARSGRRSEADAAALEPTPGEPVGDPH